MKKKTIVVVEDNPVIVSVYRSKLQAEGFSVEVAADGQEGWKTIQRTRPDLVLLDLVLPKMSGIEILERLRAENDFQSLPVIVFSSTYVSDEAWRAGATRVLNKASHSPKQVIEEVKTLLAASAQMPPPDKPLNEEAELQAELQKIFRAAAPDTVSALRMSLQSFLKTPNDQVNLYDLYRKIHAVTGNAELSGLRPIALLAAPLEMLLKALSANPKQINPSVLRTVAQAVGLLVELFERNSEQFFNEKKSFNVLVLDDEEIARRAASGGLEKAEMRALCISEPMVALKVLRENHFDLLFLDIEMPELNGLELCHKLRELPLHANTPVVLMTGVSKFEFYLQAALEAGNEIIAKPFHYAEVIIKALTLLIKKLPETQPSEQNAGLAV